MPKIFAPQLFNRRTSWSNTDIQQHLNRHSEPYVNDRTTGASAGTRSASFTNFPLWCCPYFNYIPVMVGFMVSQTINPDPDNYWVLTVCEVNKDSTIPLCVLSTQTGRVIAGEPTWRITAKATAIIGQAGVVVNAVKVGTPPDLVDLRVELVYSPL